MNKNTLKKRTNLKNPKCKEYREMLFIKNSIIIRKNQSFRHVYLLKSGEAAIFQENNSNQILHKYKQGDYLNSIEVCMSVTSFKTVKAISRCQILLLSWNKEHQDQQRKNSFIPKMQSLKFYQIPIFKNLPYPLILELVLHFKKQFINRYEIMNFFKTQTDSTCFLISGSLILESNSQKNNDTLKRSLSCQAKQSRKSILNENNLKLIKFQKGQLLFMDYQQKYVYVCQSEKCQIVSIKTRLLQTFLDPESVQRIRKLKQTQKSNLIQRKSKTFKALKRMSKSINRQHAKSQIIPQKFKNQIVIKCDNFQKARQSHYLKNNRNFRSFSEQKKRIIEQRDKGYKQISQLNRRKYGRNYIYEKRMQISKNIHRDDFITEQTLGNNNSQPSLKRGITVYQTVTLKDDYGIMKQSPLMKIIRLSRSRQRKNYTSHNSSEYKRQKNDHQIQSLTLKSVKKIRMNFQSKSKTLLKDYSKRQIVNQL